jgi:hypothetical protein
MFLVLPEHALVAPARRGAAAVARNEDRRLQRHPLVELAVNQAFLAAVEALEILPDARLAGINAVDADLDRPVIGKQVRSLAPQAPVHVVTEGALQLLDSARAFQFLDASGQRIDFRVDAASGMGGLLRQDGGTDEPDQNRAFHGFSEKCLSEMYKAHCAPALRSRMNFIHSSDVGITG